MTPCSARGYNDVRMNIAIDGPAGAGKSTVARRVAASLGYLYVDTGAMYRALAWAAQDREIPVTDTDAIIRSADTLDLRLLPPTSPGPDDDDEPTRVFVGAVEITGQIRSPAISNLASPISAIPGVRTRMVAAQQELARASGDAGVVMEGRDIGTVVLPEADLKVFLTASTERRAGRRQAELAERGSVVAYDDLLRDIRERDARDASRDVAPMVPAADAHILDSDPLNIDEVVSQILAWHNEIASQCSVVGA